MAVGSGTLGAGRRVSRRQARRIALAAQGFLDPRPAPMHSGSRHLQRVIGRVGVVQIDSVNVVTRSQYLPFFSRLGPYDTALLDRFRDRGPRRLVEYWAHEASLIPPATWPLLEHRMLRAEHESWGGMRRVAVEQPGLVEAVRAAVQRRAMTAREVESALGHDTTRPREDWGWNWSLAKNALEHLFWAGAISSAGRTSQFERRYAGLGHVVPAAPPEVRRRWLDRNERLDPAQALVELTRIAARANGIATEASLADYFRLRREQIRPAVATLLAGGELAPVEVVGWPRAAFLWTGDRPARIPRSAHVEALLSPFDSLIWHRERTSELFDFHYRIEIYTPAHKRIHGYYVLPFLYGDTLVARTDLKADRGAGVLRVPRVGWEPEAPAAARAALVAQLESLAGWLGLAALDLPTGWADPP